MSIPREVDDYGVDCSALSDEAVLAQAEKALEDRGHWPDGHVLAEVTKRLRAYARRER